jgi:hypothetical protein
MKRLMFIAFCSLLLNSCYSPCKEELLKKYYPQGWQYEALRDDMTSRTYYTAKIYANDFLKLKEPYGESCAWLALQSDSNITHLSFHIGAGQIIAAHNPEGGYIRVRFDDDDPQSYFIKGYSDGSSDAVRIWNTSLKRQMFLDRLKKSKTMILEVLFYDNGYQQMHFNTEGLIWHIGE